MKKFFITPAAIFILLVLAILAIKLYPISDTSKKTAPLLKSQDSDVKSLSKLSVIAQNLEVPWALSFLPDNSILVTERPGRVRLIDKDGKLKDGPIAVIDEVATVAESGLHGIVLHPNFPQLPYVYFYYTYQAEKEQALNRVARYQLKNNTLSDKKIIVDKIPGAPVHDGGRIKFGPDKFLYITTGDATNPSLSQDKNSLAGKILRVTDDGSPAPGNPFGNLVYSLGHRNPQGITWDDTDRLWSTEHGSSGTDELNIIEPGKNYGWPDIRGDQKQEGLVGSIIHSGSDTWAPAGAAYLNGSIFFAGLKGKALYKAKINGNHVTLTEHFKSELGRIREVVVGPDNMLYITTSNRDGRGIPTGGDDKIIKVNPNLL